MMRKRPTPSSSSPPAWLLELPNEPLVHHIARMLLAAHDVRAALRLRASCKSAHERLQPVFEAAQLAHSLRWDGDLSRGCALSCARTELTRLNMYSSDDPCTFPRMLHPNSSWAAGGLLPSRGSFSFLFKIDRVANNSGRMLIGVSDSPSTCAWGMCPFDGRLYRRSRSHDTKRVLNFAPPPAAFPDGDNRIVLYDESGQRYNLDGRAQGAVIECLIDADEGTVAFRVNGGRTLTALSGFPPETQLRPWARLMGVGDRVTVDARADLLLPTVG